MPETIDILYSRRATKGIQEYSFTIENVPFVFVDVGGQRPQRQKWYQTFDNATAIMFIAAASDYNLILEEDRKTNRLVEALNIFDAIVNNRTFENINIILLLNKRDLLYEKVVVERCNIRQFFPSFPADSDPFNFENVRDFELGLFNGCKRGRRVLYSHVTKAVDTKNIEFVFNSVRDIILRSNIAELALK